MKAPVRPGDWVRLPIGICGRVESIHFDSDTPACCEIFGLPGKRYAVESSTRIHEPKDVRVRKIGWKECQEWLDATGCRVTYGKHSGWVCFSGAKRLTDMCATRISAVISGRKTFTANMRKPVRT